MIQPRAARILLALAIAVTALGSVAAPAGARGEGPRRSGSARSEGCGTPYAAGVSELTIDSAGTARAYRLAVPDDYTGDEPVPLILNFHGLGSNAIQQAVYSQLEEKGPQRGYVVLTPNGTPPRMFWNILPNLEQPDDVAYTGELLDATEAALCIDRRRVYSTGISNGAGLSVYLGCHLRDRIAAIAPVAGVNLLQGNCSQGEDLPVIAFHGRADSVVPYEGGSTLGSLAVSSVEDAVAAWAHRAGCRARPRVETVSPSVERIDYKGCDRKSDVQLYTVTDGGHTWPGSIDVPRLGHVTNEINAADLILDFFDAHRRR